MPQLEPLKPVPRTEAQDDGRSERINDDMLRVVFMGTPEFAVPTLAEIAGAGHEVAAVYTQPPRPAGRGMAERKSPVHVFAETPGSPCCTPASLKGAAESSRRSPPIGADVAVVVAYGLILPKPCSRRRGYGCLNLHASALPRWRGAAPIQRAIMAGDRETAATVMRMEEGLDTGPVCLAEAVAIGPDTTAGELHDAIAERGASLMVRALGALERGRARLRAATGATASTYAAKIDKDETRIDFARPRARCTTASAACRRCRAPGSRPAAGGQARAHQGAAHRAGRGVRHARRRARRRPDRRLRRWRGALAGGAARRQEADARRRNSCAASRSHPGRALYAP